MQQVVNDVIDITSEDMENMSLVKYKIKYPCECVIGIYIHKFTSNKERENKYLIT